jgi:hypothetical protein
MSVVSQRFASLASVPSRSSRSSAPSTSGRSALPCSNALGGGRTREQRAHRVLGARARPLDVGHLLALEERDPDVGRGRRRRDQHEERQQRGGREGAEHRGCLPDRRPAP